MDTFISFLKSLKLRRDRKTSYSIRFGAPNFTVKGLGLKGMKVGGLERKFFEQGMLQLLDIWEHQEPPSVVLAISAHKGVRVFDKSGIELVAYKINEIAYCSVDAKIFVFMANQKGDVYAQCHAFFCDDNAKAQAICFTMARAFDLAFRNWRRQKKTVTDL